MQQASATPPKHAALGQSLVIAPQWIGDAVMTEPLLRRLAQRGERLTVGALPWVAPVYRAMPQVAHVIELPFAHGGLQWAARRSLASQLKGQFDTAYVLPNSLKSALLPFFAGIPKRIGYVGESRFGLLNQRLPNPRAKPPMVAFYSALASLGAQNTAPAALQVERPELQLDHALRQRTLADWNLPDGGFYVCAPGAEFGPAKRWPASHFADLALQLGGPVVLLGSGKEAALCDEIAGPVNAAHPGRCLNLAGRTTLPQALALIAASRATITNDSGLMHVAAALGVPQVAIFGSSSPLHTPPLSPHAQVLWLKNQPSYQPPLDCAPCFARTCPLGHTRCLNDLPAEQVLHALERAQASVHTSASTA